MTPHLFTKLAIRLLTAALLLRSLPLNVAMGCGYGLTLLRGNTPSEWLPFFAGLGVIIIGGLLSAALFWRYAERLATLIVPATLGEGSAEAYAAWQRWGLVCLGGWLLLDAYQAIPMIIFGNSFYTGNTDLFGFNLIAALILIFDGRAILSGLSRLFSTNWTAVVLAQRRKRLDRQDN